MMRPQPKEHAPGARRWNGRLWRDSDLFSEGREAAMEKRAIDLQEFDELDLTKPRAKPGSDAQYADSRNFP